MPVLDYQVRASADDCWWYAGGSAFNYTGEAILLGRSTTRIYAMAARFASVVIPVGARITAAYMSFYYYSYSGIPPACTLKFEKSANPTAILSASDGDGRTKTTASISVTGPTSGAWWNTGDISAIIQELVNAYSYAAGAAMQCIIVCSGDSGYNYSFQRSYDYAGNIYGPKLHIEYALGGVGLIGDGLVGNSVLIGGGLVG